MKQLLRDIQDRLFGAADTVCLQRAALVTEAWQRHADEPAPLRRALALRHVLEHMTIDVTTNPIFAGNTSSAPRAWMLLPEHGLNVDAQVAIEHEDLRGFLNDKVPAPLRSYWIDLASPGGAGHLAVDLDLIVNRGLRSVLDQIDRHADAGDADQQTYRKAMRMAVDAVIAWSHRCADVAAATAQVCDDPVVARCHRRVAEACRHVPEHPARNLLEGLQAIALTHVAMALEGQRLSVSIGLPDRALACFAPEAAADPDAAADLVGAFLLRLAANSYLGKGSKTQAITIGGADHEGRDCCNAVTIAFLDAFDRVPVADPHLFLRWHDALHGPVRQRALAMLSRGRSMPLLVHDRPTVCGFVEAGVAPGDASDYCVIGCNELGIPGRLFDSAVSLGGAYNDLELLNRTLLQLPDPEAIGDMSALLAKLAPTYESQIRGGLSHREATQRQMAQTMPTPLTTSLMRDSAARGRDLMVAMPYRVPCIYTRGLANAANALAAIQHLVFTEMRVTLGQLIAAMHHNLDEPSIGRLLEAAPKWGNDDDGADRWATALVALRRQVLDKLAAEGLPRPVVCHVVRSLHHVDGARIGASLDGRHAGTPVGDSLGGITGTMRQGPTAMLASVLKLDAARDFAGGTNLNLTLPPGQAQPAILEALIEGFFGDGGQELQISVLDAAQLREAQRHPERFCDLVIRVAGLNARFVELSRIEQDELIARAVAAAGDLSTISILAS
ncbi:MAG: pyruvate formate lyase family protein [Phycisphaeraceae bacterium]